MSERFNEFTSSKKNREHNKNKLKNLSLIKERERKVLALDLEIIRETDDANLMAIRRLEGVYSPRKKSFNDLPEPPDNNLSVLSPRSPRERYLSSIKHNKLYFHQYVDVKLPTAKSLPDNEESVLDESLQSSSTTCNHSRTTTCGKTPKVTIAPLSNNIIGQSPIITTNSYHGKYYDTNGNVNFADMLLQQATFSNLVADESSILVSEHSTTTHEPMVPKGSCVYNASPNSKARRKQTRNAVIPR